MTVFVVQRQMKLNDSGNIEPRFDTLVKAERFGTLDFLLGPSAHPFVIDEIIGGLHHKLKNITEEDHMLLVGNSSLIGAATAIAAHYSGGKLKLLQWSGRNNDYIEISVRLF